jgi:SAM-dependent methyltransferase
MMSQTAAVTADILPDVGARSGFGAVDEQPEPARLASYLDGAARSMVEVKERLLDLLALPVGGRMLDVGCGIGHDVVRASTRDGSCTSVGIDASASLLAEGRGRWPASCFVRGDGRRLPFRSGSFDGCRIERVLQHVEAPDLVLEEVTRVLHPTRGRIALWEPDWATMYFDASDTAVGAEVARVAARRVVNGRIGRSLERRLLELGYLDVGAEPDVGTFTSIAAMRAMFAFDVVVRDLRAGHTLGDGRVDGWLAELHERDGAGRFRAGFVRTYAWGRRSHPAGGSTNRPTTDDNAG